MDANLFETLYTRLVDLFFNGDVSENVTRERAEFANVDFSETLVPGDLPDTYCWADVDYANVNRSAWKTTAHYARLIDSLVRNGRSRLEKDDKYREKMVGALRYWVEHDFKNPNWWHNDIGMPRNIGDITLALKPYLSAALYKAAVSLVGRGSMKTREDIRRWTGANLIWGIMDTLRHAVLTEDEELLKTACDRAMLEFKIGYGREEGLKPDGSFWQHGPRLYTGGYGLCYAEDVSRLAYLLSGTSYAIPAVILNRIPFLVLNGFRPMVYRDGMDYRINGREMTREGTLSTKRIRGVIQSLLKIGGIPREQELKDFLSELNGEKVPEPTLTYFPYVSMMTSVGEHAYMGVKCLSNTQYDAEICNGEGELCYNMSYGTHLCLMHTGTEYFNIAPVWNYARIPGTTARNENDAELYAHRDWWCLPLPSPISGGLRKGNLGILYELAEHDGISVHAAYFFMPGKLLMLGAGIKDAKGGNLVTTLNQCYLYEIVTENSDGSLSHNGFRYKSLDPEVKLWHEEKSQSGSWHRNNFERTDRPISKDVFTVAADCRPDEHDSYAFLILDELSEGGMEFTVVSNTKDYQAIRLSDGTMMEIHYTENSGFCMITGESSQ